MRKLRSRWLAIMGGAVLVTLSVSAVFGADPADDTDDASGQTIAGFVHSLIFTQDDPADEETADHDREGETVEEAGVNQGTSDETDEAHNPDEAEEAGSTASSRGECVSAVAHDKNATGGKHDNHGGAVSEAAHECGSEEVVGAEETSADEDDTEEASAKAERKADRAEGKAERIAERTAEKADRKP